MYEAIVFLPLLGAVIAGAIALIGARNRLPGADPPPPDDDHAAPARRREPRPRARRHCMARTRSLTSPITRKSPPSRPPRARAPPS